MDQQLKERLVGATVLVVLAIILIPAVLDGPGRRSSTAEQRLELPTESDESRRTVRIPLQPETGPRVRQPDPVESRVTEQSDSNGNAAAGTAASEPAPEPAREVATTREPPAATPEARQEPEPSEPEQQAVRTEAPAGDAAWTVQVGSFSSEENADSLRQRLASLGYDEAYISRYNDGSRVHYRVRVGGFADREAAASKAEEIKRRSGEPARPAQNTQD